MPDIKSLLESMTKFAGEKVGQKPGDQVRGDEPMPKKGGGKQHPYHGRLIGGGAAESVEHDEFVIALKEEFEQYVAEYGASGSGISSYRPEPTPDQVRDLKQQDKAQDSAVDGQIAELRGQIKAARAQIAQLNRSLPMGANPVEKAMALSQTNAERSSLSKQIEQASQAIAQLERQKI